MDQQAKTLKDKNLMDLDSRRALSLPQTLLGVFCHRTRRPQRRVGESMQMQRLHQMDPPVVSATLAG